MRTAHQPFSSPFAHSILAGVYMGRVEVIRYTFRLLGLLEAGARCAPYIIGVRRRGARAVPQLKSRDGAVNLGFVQCIHEGALLLSLNGDRQNSVVRVTFLIAGNHRMRHLAAQ